MMFMTWKLDALAYLGEGVVAKVDEGSTELGGGDVAGTVLVDGLEEVAVGIIGGLGALVVLGEEGRESLEVQGLGGELDLAGQLLIAKKLNTSEQGRCKVRERKQG